VKMGAGVRSVSAPLQPPGRIVAASFAAISVGAVIGASLAADVPLGVALLVAACYAPLVFLNFRLAIVLWIPLVFLEAIPAFNLGAKAAGLLLFVGWLAALHTSGVTSSVLRRHRRLLEAFVALLVWVALSMAWAPNLDRAARSTVQWWAVAAIFLLVATCVPHAAALRTVVAAFVAGGVAAVLTGFVLGDLTPGGAGTSVRFEGAAGDPNYLASGLVPGIVLAAGLAAAYRAAMWRWLMVIVIGLLALGVVMSQSRGAAVASVATMAAALIFFKRRRLYVVALTLLAVGFSLLSFMIVPGAWDRISAVDRPGPRGDLWTVAWRVTKDHPVVGVGTNNFAAVAQNYVREPGTLRSVALISERPKAVHNLYLQLLTENGLPGIVLFTVVAGGCLRAAWFAGQRFEAVGRPDLEALARSILVAQVAILAAAIFLSSQIDKRLWILLAFGPAALEVSRRTFEPRRSTRESPPPPSRTASLPVEAPARP
jgi:O-antigen ligase